MRQEHVCETESPEATIALGETLGRCLAGGLMIGLVGPLGSGKTQLVKGLACGNAPDALPTATSPTFTLVHEYTGRFHLYHVDVYRLRGAKDLLALGLEEWLRPDAVVIVEWADRARQALGDAALWIELAVTGVARRTVTLDANGATAVRCLDDLLRAGR